MKTGFLLAILLFGNNNWKDNIQTGPSFPLSVDLETLDGKIVSSATLLNDKEILVLDFWSIFCGPCIMTFDAIRDNYEDWSAKTGTRIIAIASQKRDERTLELIRKHNWPFEIYFDPEYKLFISTSRLHKKGQVELGFPTMFFFDKEYELIGKLSGAKVKLIDGIRPPREGEPVIMGMEDYFEINLKEYYEFFDALRNKRKEKKE